MMIMVGSVVALDAVIIGIYYAAGVSGRAVKTQQTFVAVWVIVTLIVLLPQLKKIRQLRRGRS